MSHFGDFWIAFDFQSLLASLVGYASSGFKIASRLLQTGLLRPIWAPLRPKLAPSWLKLGPCWIQIGSKLVQVGAKIGSGRFLEVLGRVQGELAGPPGGPRGAKMASK